MMEKLVSKVWVPILNFGLGGVALLVTNCGRNLGMCRRRVKKNRIKMLGMIGWAIEGENSTSIGRI
jgi:hypothetical protein